MVGLLPFKSSVPATVTDPVPFVPSGRTCAWSPTLSVLPVGIVTSMFPATVLLIVVLPSRSKTRCPVVELPLLTVADPRLPAVTVYLQSKSQWSFQSCSSSNIPPLAITSSMAFAIELRGTTLAACDCPLAQVNTDAAL